MITDIQRISSVYANQATQFRRRPADSGNSPVTSAEMPEDRVSLSGGTLKRPTRTNGEQQLTEEDKQQVTTLKKRDNEVRAHEQAHMAAGSGIVQGGATYEYQAGPDGKQYAVGGEVKIDVSPEHTPEATIRKMEQVRRAALAPAQPSGTDRAVAAQANQVEAKARLEQNSQEQGSGGTEQPNPQFDAGWNRPSNRQTAESVGGRIDLMA